MTQELKGFNGKKFETPYAIDITLENFTNVERNFIFQSAHCKTFW